MPGFHLSSLRVRLVMLVVISAIPALGFIFYTASEQRHNKEQEIRAETMLTARLAAQDIEQLVEGTRQVLVVLSKFQAVQDHDIAACNAYFSSFMRELPAYTNFGVTGPNGDIYCSAVPVRGRINIADRTHIKTAILKKAFSFGEYQIGAVTGKQNLNAALPVYNARKQLKAIVYAGIDLNWFRQQLSKIKIPPDRTLHILDRNGTILYRYPDPDKWIGKNMAGLELNKITFAKGEGIVEAAGADGQIRIYAFTTVHGTDGGMYARSGISRQAAVAEINLLLTKGFLTVLMIAGMAGLIAWFGADFFLMRRMNALMKVTEDISGGILGTRVDIPARRDEIDRLGECFNRMAQTLESQNQRRRISEEKYLALFEESKDVIFVSTPEGRYLDINPAGVELYGYSSREEMLKLDINRDIYLNTEDRRAYMQSLEEKGFVRDYEMRLKRKDGKILTVLASAIAVREEQGKVVEYRGINHDITDRKHAEEELRKRDILISTVLETSPAAIYALDKEGFVLTWNKGAESIFGCVKEDVIGKSYPFVPEEFGGSMQKILRGEPYIGVESKRLRKDGSVIDVSVTSAPLLGSGGEVTGLISVVTDITQQKRMESEQFILEDQLRQAQKMEAVGQLAGGVAHDFNNILSAIVGYSHLTMMSMGKDDPNLHNLQEIIASVDRATLLTQGLLAFSRKQMVTLAVYNLNEIVEKFDLFLLRLLREDIELKTILTTTVLPVMADRGQIEQILMNLVTNARDALPEGGRIIIETDYVEIDKAFINVHGFGRTGEYALITLTDTGIGIPDNIKDKIFEPFFTTKEEGKGTGLGLSTVYGIVKKHEGYINVYSQTGIGTTFKIYLPALHILLDGERKADEVIRTAGGTETILIAEDNDAVRRMTSETLKSFGYSVIEASDGLDAIEKFKEHQDIINLVVMDGIMPKMNGREAWQVINAINPVMKAVFVSGYAEDIFTKDGMPDMDMPFISKPAPPSVLLTKIREILDR